jgi:hypothetical protein
MLAAPDDSTVGGDGSLLTQHEVDMGHQWSLMIVGSDEQLTIMRRAVQSRGDVGDAVVESTGRL